MSWTNPPPQITALRAVLVACDAFTARGYEAAQVHYPVAIESDRDVRLPAFVLALDGARAARVIIVASAAETEADPLDPGALQMLAMELRDQLPSRYRLAAGGLVIAEDPDISEVGEPSDGMIAAGDDLNAIEITLRIGLDQGA